MSTIFQYLVFFGSFFRTFEYKIVNQLYKLSGEVVIQPDNMQRDGIINALLSFDKYFKNDPYVKIYGTFDGYMDVLFNVSLKL